MSEALGRVFFNNLYIILSVLGHALLVIKCLSQFAETTRLLFVDLHRWRSK